MFENIGRSSGPSVQRRCGAPPTAEQSGLIGNHWSKGWIIEDNTISHSVCSGIALGKHGDEFDNTSANSAEEDFCSFSRAYFKIRCKLILTQTA
ncbi:MAG: hypothetical protein PF904_18825 [Kiritimatiellae bacterium]|jgi:hypothetical protein|nr:hypothetical protein [Kiritimatiellia bacterium]